MNSIFKHAFDYYLYCHIALPSTFHFFYHRIWCPLVFDHLHAGLLIDGIWTSSPFLIIIV